MEKGIVKFENKQKNKMKKSILITLMLVFTSLFSLFSQNSFMLYHADKISFHRMDQLTKKSKIIKTILTDSEIFINDTGVVVDKNQGLTFLYTGVSATERSTVQANLLQIPAKRAKDGQDILVTFVSMKPSGENWIMFVFDGGAVSYRIKND